MATSFAREVAGEQSGQISRHAALHAEDGVVYIRCVIYIGLCYSHLISFRLMTSYIATYERNSDLSTSCIFVWSDLNQKFTSWLNSAP